MTITVSGGEQIISSLRRLSEGLPNATKAALDASLKKEKGWLSWRKASIN